jgi:hypothetical protein
MKYKKLKLCILLTLGLGLTGLRSQTIYVKEKSGIQTSYLISTIKKISFSSGNILISKMDGNSSSFLLAGLRYFNFKELTTEATFAETENRMVLIYPNPAVDLLNIQLSRIGSPTGIIELLSIDGKVVYSQAINMYDNKFQIDVSSLLHGIYLCRIISGASIVTTKFFKK